MVELSLMPGKTLGKHFLTSSLDCRFAIERLPENAVCLRIPFPLILDRPCFEIRVLKTECLPEVGILMG